MEKNFKTWHELKEKINNKEDVTYFKEREVWFCYLGCNVGYEQDGKGKRFLRPVLIFKQFNKNVFLGIPLTSAVKNNKFYYTIKIQNKSHCLILSQIRLIDSKRLVNKKYTIDAYSFTKIKKAFIDLIS